MWDYIKSKYEVESRNDMTEQQWTELSVELKAAETTPKLFEALIKRVKIDESKDTEKNNLSILTYISSSEHR